MSSPSLMVRVRVALVPFISRANTVVISNAQCKNDTRPFFMWLGSPLMIPKNEIVALRTGHKVEELIAYVCSHGVSYIVAVEKQSDLSRVIVQGAA